MPSEEQVIEWITSLSNWGRWGEDDQYALGSRPEGEGWGEGPEGRDIP